MKELYVLAWHSCDAQSNESSSNIEGFLFMNQRKII